MKNAFIFCSSEIETLNCSNHTNKQATKEGVKIVNPNLKINGKPIQKVNLNPGEMVSVLMLFI